MDKASNIKFEIDEGGINFSFNDNKTAFLQLPDTGDSQHRINNLDEDEWTDNERDIFKQLERFYFDFFNDVECAAASAMLCDIIEHVEEVNYKNRQIFVAFSVDDTTHLLVESAYKNYYNKSALFDNFEHNAFSLFGYDEDYDESEIIKKAVDQMHK
jgi:hypothetical protein